MPNYLVLQDGPHGWRPLNTEPVEAPTDIVAIDETVGDNAGTYVAIPTRFFRKREVVIENTPTRRIVSCP